MRIKPIHITKNEVICFLILFGLEFDVPIIGDITMRKLSFLYLLVLFFSRRGTKVTIRRNLIAMSVMIGILLTYVAILLDVRFGGEIRTPSGAFNLKEPLFLALDMMVFPLLLSEMFADVKEYAKFQWIIILFQSTVVLIGRAFLPIRIFIFRHFAYGDGRLEKGIVDGIRSVGFGLSGASGSMVLFAGLICGIYLFYQTKDRKEKNRIIAGWLIIMGAQLFMGRTGLYFGVISMIIVTLDCVRRLDKSIIRIVLGGFAIVLACWVFIFVASDSYGIRVWMKWITEIGNLFSESGTISAIRQMPIPELSFETFFGTGFRRGITNNGIVISHDAGYIQTYASIGVIGSIIYYGSIYGFYISMVLKVRSIRKRRIYWLFLLAIMIGEMKEPFLAKTILTVIMSSMLFIEIKQARYVTNEATEHS